MDPHRAHLHLNSMPRAKERMRTARTTNVIYIGSVCVCVLAYMSSRRHLAN